MCIESRLIRLLAALCVCAVLSVLAGGARAATPITLSKSFAGNVNFVGTQKTMRTGVDTCDVTTGAVTAELKGIPASAKILSAQLYWAGSGDTIDDTVTFQAGTRTPVTVKAPAARKSSASVSYYGFSSPNYFGAGADVTTEVAALRNGFYKFSNLTVDNGAKTSWCTTWGVVGGFALLVVYEDVSEPFRVLNVYEGFMGTFQGTNIPLTLDNFTVPNPLPANSTGRVGYIAWEGEASKSGEVFQVNGADIFDTFNPQGGQFNSASSINMDPNSYAIDFDVYTITPPVIKAGQTSANTLFQSGADMMMLQVEIIAVPNTATADLVMGVQRNGVLQVGSPTTYTLSVSNNGPNGATGPIKVTTTLPAELNYVSVTGSGWTCTVTGKDISCSAPGPLANGASLPPITLTVKAASSSAATLTAKVSGPDFDNNLSNNTASDTSSAPAADLSLVMVRSSSLVAGCCTDYRLTVSNAGPGVASASNTVTGTVPAGQAISTVGGSNWACSVSGQTYTCTFVDSLGSLPDSLGVGATAPPIVLSLNTTSCGTYTNSATVTGKSFDNNAGNNTASVIDQLTSCGTAAYRFTTQSCADGALIPSAGCTLFAGPVTAGAPTTIYLTSVSIDSAGVVSAKSLSATADTARSVSFASACDDPAVNSGVSVSYAAINLQPCTPDASPAWTATTLTFLKGAPSVTANFNYLDVGKIKLKVQDQAGANGSTSPFVVRPAQLALKVVRTRDQAPNPATSATGFAKAGESFTIAVGAKTAAGGWAPGFGAELGGAIGSLITLQAADGTDMAAALGVTGGGNGLSSRANGTVFGTQFAWNDVGMINVTPALSAYLGTAAVAGVAQDIGSFYPDHFETRAESIFPCATNMACPGSVAGAVYSGQPFPLNVDVWGVSQKVKSFAGPISLAAYDNPGGVVQNPGGAPVAPLAPVSLTAQAGLAIRGMVTYKLAVPFDSAQPRAQWTKPTAIYLRATVSQNVVKDNAVAPTEVIAVTITSKDARFELGVMVVDGRLQLANAFGSELLRLPVRMNAQYWNGTAWELNPADSSTIADSVVFSNCAKALASAGSNNCNALVKTASPPGALKAGAGTIWLAAPGQGKPGSAWLQVQDPSLPWLPSTKARAVFGIYKNPLIYLREVY